ncbi:DUF4850 domain-containing protein [Paenibacillus tengchongensis]|uniref:DUF4850 domain-containing protein n=1 Tax=Paenibacillus tengchongensis TaxID=2608684 RepID=UPI00124DF7C1|nr:DUF4850 domain-containing protein [Paenibacillus tengchongensis]
MSKEHEQWEEHLKDKPFGDGSFTPEMRRNVERRLAETPRGGRRRWRYAIALLPLTAVLLLAGYSSGWFGGYAPGPEAAVPPAADGVNAGGNADTGGSTDAGDSAGNNGNIDGDSLPGIGGEEGPGTPAPDAEPPQPLVAFPAAGGGKASVPLPLTTILAVPSLDDGSGPATEGPPALPEMNDPVPAGLMGALQAALVYRANDGSGYLLLAPKSWQGSAFIGANGSYGADFQDPDDPLQTLRYSDNAWSCHGCAVVTIGSYYPGKAEWAEEYGYSFEPMNFTSREVLDAEQRTVRYTLATDEDGYVKAGAIYYEEGEWGYHLRQIEVALAPDSAQNEALEAILDFFLAHRGALEVPAPADGNPADSAEAQR